MYFFLLIIFWLIKAIQKDRLKDCEQYVDVDLFIVSSLIVEEIETIDLLNRPCKYELDVLKEKTDELLQKIGIKRYDHKEEEKNSFGFNYFLEYVNDIRKHKTIENKKIILSFLEKMFLPAESEVETFDSTELKKNCCILKYIKNPEIIEITKVLHSRWKYLQKINKKSGSSSTRIFMKNPFIVPGDRFQEFYYWDTWFILEGLIASDMKIMALNIIKNCIDLIDKNGFIPNGARKYYTNRSQPPFFCSMLNSLLKFEDSEIKDLILSNGLEQAIKEAKFFEDHKMIDFLYNNKKYKMFRYYVDSNYPRLESFRNDLETFEKAFKKNPEDEYLQQKIFSSLKSAAESGIDFSSRWFAKTNDMSTIKTIDHIPCDLNALMVLNYKIIAKLLKLKKDFVNSNEYQKKAIELEKNINEVLWNKKKRMWNDYDTKKKKHIEDIFFASNFFPLFFELAIPSNNPYEIILVFFKQIFGYKGGIPAAGKETEESKQQWDFPNVWAPYVYLFENYFRNVLKEKEMAFHIASSFFKSVFNNYKNTKLFLEKYSAINNDDCGDGGEYPIQNGFGWTNGVALSFIKKYGDRLGEPFDFEKSKINIKERLEFLNKRFKESDESSSEILDHEIPTCKKEISHQKDIKSNPV